MNVPTPVMSLAVLLVTFVLLIVLDRIKKSHRLRGTTLLGLFAALILLPFFSQTPVDFGVLRFDALTIFFSLIFLGVAIGVVLSSKEKSFVYYGSVLLSTIGMILAASSQDLLALYLSIELVTVPTYVLVGFKRTLLRLESAMKYFVVSIVASALMLLGVILLASNAGQTGLVGFTPVLDGIFLLGVAAFVAGLGFKLGIWPFNFWIPDVYEGAPPAVAGFLAGASKKAAYAAFFRVAVIFAVSLQNWSVIIAVLAALTMTIPNIIALLQENAKRMLAYSIMTHAGFLLMGIAVGAYAATAFHAFVHGFMALGAFLVLGVFSARKLEKISQLRGLGFRNPMLAASLTLFLLSLAGMPILAGFASKLYLFYAVAKEMLWLTILAIINSGIALFYYFKLIREMYGYKTAGKALKIRYGVLVAIILCLFVLLFFGIYPQPMIEFAVRAVSGI